MPPRKWSRHTFATSTRDDEGRVYLSDPKPFLYRELADTRQHVVAEGDTLFSLARIYFRGIERPDGLWWVIADFQPDPILDPTVKLEIGSVVHVPSLRTVVEEVFSERRRREPAT